MASNEAKTATQQTATSTERVITIVTTRGEKRKIAFQGDKWEQLSELLRKGGTDVNGDHFSGYNLQNTKCVESTNKTTLEHKDARVPEGNFNLFLMPLKSKSGGEIRDKVKALSQQNKEAVKAHFGNWTIKKEDELSELLKTYNESKSSASAPKKEKQAATKKSTAKVAPAKPTTSKPSNRKPAVAEAEPISSSNESEASAQRKLNFTEVLTAAQQLSTQDQQRLVSQLKAGLAPEKTDEDLDKEMMELSRGFSDVRM